MRSLRARHPAVLALLAGGAVAALVPASAAVAFQSPPTGSTSVEVQSPAALVARGAGVAVTVTYRCPAGQDASLSVFLTQRSGSETISASGGREVECTGEEEETTVVVTADGRVFKKGTAVGRADLFTCGFSFCGTMTDSKEVTITR